MNNTIKLIVAATAMTVAAGAFAANTVNTASTAGAFVGVNGGFGKVDQSVSGTGTTGKNDNTGFSYGIDGGYMYNQYVGLDLGYTKFASANLKSGIKAKSNYNVHAAVKGVYPMGQSFDLFGKLGLAYVHTNTTIPSNVVLNGVNSGVHHSTRPYLAAGVDYIVTQNVGVNFQVAGTTKSGNKVPAMYNATVGVQYTF